MRDSGSAIPSMLRLLFVPSVAVMNRLSYGRKFILICALVSGPLAVLAGLQFSTATVDIEFNRRERSGIAYAEPAQDLLLAVQRHRVLSAATLLSPEVYSHQLDEAARAGDRALELLKRRDENHGLPLRTIHILGEIRAHWLTLRSVEGNSVQESDREHEALASRITHLISHQIANRSNLILDPDLDSYWLMDASIVKLPALTNAVGEVCTSALRRPDATQGSLERTVELAAGSRGAVRLSRDLADINLGTAVDATASFGRSPTIQSALQQPISSLIDAVQQQAEQVAKEPTTPVRAEPSIVRTQRLVATTLEALDRISLVFERIRPELDRLVAQRLDRHQTQRTRGLISASAAAAVLGYLFIGFWLSVRASIRALSSESFSPPSRDELGQIAVAYNQARGEKTVLQQQLVQADRLATIGKLAAGTAHELNEPLGAILGFAQLALKNPELQDQPRRDLTKIVKAALHAREVIRKLLLFAHQTPPRKIPVSLNQVVDDSLDLLTLRSEKEGVILVRDLAPDLPEIVADPAHVRQVVINLVVNAIQASARGQHVTVLTRMASDHVSLVVQDEGTGMSKESLDNLFLPFFTTKDVGQGTGLGLSVVHGIVTAHRGSIQVESTAANGTRFEVLWTTGNRAGP